MLEKSTQYRFIYVNISFKNNQKFIKSLEKSFSVEIPYAYLELNSELKESLDSYFYIVDTPEFITIFKKICSKYPKASFSVLGKIRGGDILRFLNLCKEENTVFFKPGDFVQLMAGEFKGLIGKVKDLQRDTVTLEYQLLKESHCRTFPLSDIISYSGQEIVIEQFKDMEKQYLDKGIRRTLLFDGTDCLHRGIKTNNTKYNGDKLFIGGIFSFYFNLLKMKELYPEYDIIVVFDNDPLEGRSELYKKAFQLNMKECKELVNNIGYKTAVGSAKDIIFSICQKDKGESDNILIYSSNPTYQSLVSNIVHVLFPKTTFRGNSFLRTPETVKALWSVNDVPKVAWVLAIMGCQNILGINDFNRNMKKSDVKKIKEADFLPELINANTSIEFATTLVFKPDFSQFVAEHFYNNLQKLLFKEIPINLSPKGDFKEKEMIDQLERLQLYKEVELIERSKRIFKGMW